MTSDANRVSFVFKGSCVYLCALSFHLCTRTDDVISCVSSWFQNWGGAGSKHYGQVVCELWPGNPQEGPREGVNWSRRSVSGHHVTGNDRVGALEAFEVKQHVCLTEVVRWLDGWKRLPVCLQFLSLGTVWLFSRVGCLCILWSPTIPVPLITHNCTIEVTCNITWAKTL